MFCRVHIHRSGLSIELASLHKNDEYMVRKITQTNIYVNIDIITYISLAVLTLAKSLTVCVSVNANVIQLLTMPTTYISVIYKNCFLLVGRSRVGRHTC